jgi:signal transduction histidine kinase
MFKTIRAKLLSVFLLFALSSIISLIIAFNFFAKSKDSLSEIVDKAEKTYILLLRDIKVTHYFFENETINSDFFETQKSNLLEAHRKICIDIERSLAELNSLQKENDFGLNDIISRLQKNFEKYKTLTDKIVNQIFLRGFKNYGVEGKMRSYAHALEDCQKEIGIMNIFLLRRHEKDFIIRQEDEYVVKHKNVVEIIKNEIKADKIIPRDRKAYIINLLDSYSKEFKELIFYDKQIGIKTHQGTKREIDQTSDRVESLISTMIHSALQREKEGLSHINTVFIIICFIYIAISIITAIFISDKVSYSIISLKEKIKDFVSSNFTKRTTLAINSSPYEIDILATNFSIMEQHIVDQMNVLKETNKELQMLFYRASHDLKSPLSTVKGLTNLAKKEISDKTAVKYFSMINQCWEKLGDIVDELGMVTELKGEQTTSEVIDFEEIILSAFSEFKSLPNFESIILSTNISLEKEFYASSKLLKIIFRHLIENGIKYSKIGGGQSYIKISICFEENELLKINIEDNGIGIDKEIHRKIFDMFFRGTNLAGGTGLGLFIVQNSLQKLNGAINLESELDKGTTFTILLPNSINKKNAVGRIIQKKQVVEALSNNVLNFL